MQAVERVLAILVFVGSSDAPVSLMDIAAGTAIDKSSCSRIVASLVKKGWLERDERTRSLLPGPATLRFSYSILRNPPEVRELTEVLSRLCELSGETVGFLRRVGASRVRVAGMEGTQQIRHVLNLGEVQPLTVGPSGKSILAFLEPELQNRLLSEVQERARIIAAQHFREVTAKGYLSTDGDSNSDSGALAAPVFDRLGVYGSLAIYGPMQRWNATQREAFSDELLAGAERITQALGGSTERFELWRSALKAGLHPASV